MSPLGVWGKSVLGSGNSKSKGPQTGVCLKGSLGSLEEGITVIGISWISLAAAPGPSALSDAMEQARGGVGGQPPPAVPDMKAGREGGFEY